MPNSVLFTILITSAKTRDFKNGKNKTNKQNKQWKKSKQKNKRWKLKILIQFLGYVNEEITSRPSSHWSSTLFSRSRCFSSRTSFLLLRMLRLTWKYSVSLWLVLSTAKLFGESTRLAFLLGRPGRFFGVCWRAPLLSVIFGLTNVESDGARFESATSQLLDTVCSWIAFSFSCDAGRFSAFKLIVTWIETKSETCLFHSPTDVVKPSPQNSKQHKRTATEIDGMPPSWNARDDLRALFAHQIWIQILVYIFILYTL